MPTQMLDVAVCVPSNYLYPPPPRGGARANRRMLWYEIAIVVYNKTTKSGAAAYSSGEPGNRFLWWVGDATPHVGIFFPCVSWQQVAWGAKNSMNLVDPASSYMLVSRTKPCKSKN